MSITQHAAARLQQRAIPPVILEYLERFGCEQRCGGASQLFFDKQAVKRLQQHLGGRRSLRHVEAWLNVYVVLGDNGSIVTAAHRTRRLKRDCRYRNQ